MKEHELNLDTIKERTSELERRIEKLEELISDGDYLHRLIWDKDKEKSDMSTVKPFVI